MENYKKPVLTIEEILNKYYYKEWVVEELREIGEITTGYKGELIQRYLNSKIVRAKDVMDIASNIISKLRKSDLKQILKDHGLKNGSDRTELIAKVLDSFSFEPYVSQVDRYCDICRTDTQQELHFNDTWEPTYFRCSICNGVLPIEHEGKLDLNKATKDVDSLSDTEKYFKKNYWQSISVFVVVLLAIWLRYGWAVGLIISLSVTSIVTYIGYLVETHRKNERDQ